MSEDGELGERSVRHLINQLTLKESDSEAVRDLLVELGRFNSYGDEVAVGLIRKVLRERFGIPVAGFLHGVPLVYEPELGKEEKEYE